jgi:ABC-type nitrate/sulfonate/bicarbonate transport system substrate-binding protein
MPTAAIKDKKMHWFKRLIAAAVLSMSTVVAGVGASYGQDRVVHIGFQKYGKLVLLKSKGSLEPKLKALGYSVTWIEFPSGPPLLEAINVGAVDFGNTGESPPIFAQAAGAPIRYVDAWAIWDPFQAAAEAATEAKTLADGTDTVPNYQFYLSSQKFLDSDPRALDAILAELREVDDWARTDIHAVAEQLSPSVGLPVPVLEVALKRQAYGIKPIDAQVIAEQQKLADTFLALGLIPKAITVSELARKPGT